MQDARDVFDGTLEERGADDAVGDFGGGVFLEREQRGVDVTLGVRWEVGGEGGDGVEFTGAVERGEGGEAAEEDGDVGDRDEEGEVVHGGGFVGGRGRQGWIRRGMLEPVCLVVGGRMRLVYSSDFDLSLVVASWFVYATRWTHC